MKGGFQALLMGGESSDDDIYSTPVFTGTTGDDVCINAMYSAAMNAQTTPSYLISDEKYLLQLLEYGQGALPVAPSVDQVTAYGCDESFDVVEDWKLMKSVGYAVDKLKVPKYGTLDYGLVGDVVSNEPPTFDFISGSSGSVSTEFDSMFRQLPAGVNSQTSSFRSVDSDEKYLLQSPEKYGYGTPTVAYADEKLKMPKYETVEYVSFNDVVSTEPPFDFISKSFGSVSGEFDSRFSQLPGLNAPRTPSFLSLSDEKYLLQSLEYGYGAFPGSYAYDAVEHVDATLKVPKYEPSDYKSLSDVVWISPPFDCISKTTGSSSRSFDLRFGKLPSLLSLPSEPGVHNCFGKLAESPKKRVRSLSPATSSILPEIEPAKVLARRRRQRVSEKTRSLQKLLPWVKKMDTATMLEEARKYVEFLQAQVSALRSMPVNSSFSSNRNPCNNGTVNLFGGGLGRLNRQQLLEVMVNSPSVQTALCSKGLCVYSIEQLVSMKKIAERNPSMMIR